MNSLTIKLASPAVRAEEFFSPIGDPTDRDAIKGLLADPEIRALLDDPKSAALLPVRRQPSRSQLRRMAAQR